MTRLFCFAGFILASLLVGEIRAGEEPKAKEPAKTLTEADNGKTIKVKVGDVVAISLKGNPTTGFGWQTTKIDEKVLRQAGEPKYATDAHPNGMVGVGGTFVFTFNSVKAGKAEVNLGYARPWEKNTKPAKAFTATIEVLER